MPYWLRIILELAIKIGSPVLLAYLKDNISKLPDWAKELIDTLINGIKDPNTNTKEAKRSARKALREKCVAGAVCQPDIKK